MYSLCKKVTHHQPSAHPQAYFFQFVISLDSGRKNKSHFTKRQLLNVNFVLICGNFHFFSCLPLVQTSTDNETGPLEMVETWNRFPERWP